MARNYILLGFVKGVREQQEESVAGRKSEDHSRPDCPAGWWPATASPTVTGFAA